MTKDYQQIFGVWRKRAIIPFMIGIATTVFLFMNTIEQLRVENVINLSFIIVLGYVIIASFVISYSFWYTGWYYSDSAVKHFAWRAKAWFGREWIDEVLDTHPRKKEIIMEYERLTRQ